MFVEILRFEDLNIKYVYIYNTKLEKKQEKNTWYFLNTLVKYKKRLKIIYNAGRKNIMWGENNEKNNYYNTSI